MQRRNRNVSNQPANQLNSQRVAAVQGVVTAPMRLRRTVVQQPQRRNRGRRTQVAVTPQQQRVMTRLLAPKPTKIPKQLTFAFNAFDKRHLPLDEISAPYTVTNFTNVMEIATSVSMDKIVIVCPRTLNPQETTTGPLTDLIAMAYDANETLGGTIPILDYVRCPIANSTALVSDVQATSIRARIHNLSVRLECLGTNTGLYPPGSAYIGTVPSLETGPYSGFSGTTLKTAWAEDSLTVGYIKSFPAASLVEKPLCLDSAIAENVSYKSWRDLIVPADITDFGSLSVSTSVEPILLYFPRCGSGDTVVNYRIVIGQQWCSRHPNNVMLRSTQKQHSATPPDLWHRAITAVKDVGPRMIDRVAEAGFNYIARNIVDP